MIGTWKNIKNYNGLYQINTNGNVKNLKGLLKSHIIVNGYCQIQLHNNRIRKTCYIHRLLANAFIPNPENKPCVNHIDGNKLNNNLKNLEWCNYKENMKHAIEIGLYNSNGMKHYNSKLTNNDVLTIHGLYFSGLFSQFVLGKLYNISHQTISKIILGKRWKKLIGA